MQMKPSKKCYDLIRSFEGFYPNAYVDPGSGDEPITIGWGTTWYSAAGLKKYGRYKVQLGDSLTREEAESDLIDEVEEKAAKVFEINPNLNQNQFDSVVSFCYNAGFPEQQVHRLRRGALSEYATHALLYINKGTPVEEGLRRRRQAEAVLFSTPIEKENDVKQKGDWFLINKNGIWEMLQNRAVARVHAHQGSFDTDLFNGHSLIVNWDRADPMPVGINVEEEKDASVARLSRYIEAVKMPTAWRNAGLKPLKLEVGDQEFLVVSGKGWAQNFRKPSDPKSTPGNYEPIPQGSYSISDIAWANVKDDYNASHGPGLGPVWVALPAQFPDDRGAFGFHLDPELDGSAGCVCFHSIEQLKKFVAALRKYDPKTLVVQWNA
jgi:GH24 family phage-related lysozyme (muramidase)